MKNIVFLFILLGVFSCGNLEKEVDLELPEYQSRLVVECYLEVGEPFSLLLSRSQSYFDPFAFNNDDFLNLFEEDATVVIRNNGEEYVLDNEFFINPFTEKIFNYVSGELVPEDFENDFELEIVSKNNEVITAKTRLLRPVPIDSVVVEFDENRDTLARTLTYFQDDPNTDDYYRRMLTEGRFGDIPNQDFATTDDFVDDGTVIFGGGFDFVEGDTITNTVFHIEKAYHDFLESIFGAVESNGNPFAQPGGIISNLDGNADAIGIFTGLSYDRVVTIISK